MPSLSQARRIIADAEAVIGSLSWADRAALLDEHYPAAPANALAALARECGR